MRNSLYCRSEVVGVLKTFVNSRKTPESLVIEPAWESCIYFRYRLENDAARGMDCKESSRCGSQDIAFILLEVKRFGHLDRFHHAEFNACARIDTEFADLAALGRVPRRIPFTGSCDIEHDYGTAKNAGPFQRLGESRRSVQVAESLEETSIIALHLEAVLHHLLGDNVHGVLDAPVGIVERLKLHIDKSRETGNGVNGKCGLVLSRADACKNVLPRIQSE